MKKLYIEVVETYPDFRVHDNDDDWEDGAIEVTEQEWADWQRGAELRSAVWDKIWAWYEDYN